MKCVYCDNTDTLNTELKITLDDGSRIVVSICDEHAEDATIRTAKAAYQKMKTDIDEVLRQAKLLGLNISESPTGITIASEISVPKKEIIADQPDDITTTPTIPQNIEVPSQPAPKISNELGDDMIPTDRLDNAVSGPSIGGSTSLGNVDSFNSYNIESVNDKLPNEVRKGYAKMTVVEGRDGQPLALPQMRRDGTGTTKINIVKTSDKMLQEQFKRIADDSMSGRIVNFKDGYNDTVRTCPLCKGECEVREKPCPKCQGKGIILVY